MLKRIQNHFDAKRATAAMPYMWRPNPGRR